MFDLEKSVAAWREALSGGGTCSAADLDELESHLRESVQRLRTSGLDEEEAFLISARRLGKADGLALEYGKAHPERVWRERFAWMLAGLLAWKAMTALAGVVMGAGLFAAAAAGARGVVLGTATVASDVLGVVVLVAAAMYLYRGVCRNWGPRRPGVWVAIGVAAYVLGWFGNWVETGSMFRLLPPSEVEITSRAGWPFMFVLNMMMPVAFGVMAMWMGRKGKVESC